MAYKPFLKKLPLIPVRIQADAFVGIRGPSRSQFA
jgi:hypothetical protein